MEREREREVQNYGRAGVGEMGDDDGRKSVSQRKSR